MVGPSSLNGSPNDYTSNKPPGEFMRAAVGRGAPSSSTQTLGRVPGAALWGRPSTAVFWGTRP